MSICMYEYIYVCANLQNKGTRMPGSNNRRQFYFLPPSSVIHSLISRGHKGDRIELRERGTIAPLERQGQVRNVAANQCSIPSASIDTRHIGESVTRGERKVASGKYNAMTPTTAQQRR